MLKKSKKEEMIKDLKQTFKDSKSVVFVNFHGMKVADETVLRRDLRDKGVAYKVYRKTLLKRVLEGRAEGEIPELGGEVAIAYSNDETASAREVYNFQKTHKGMLNILGGIFNGKFLDAVKMLEIGFRVFTFSQVLVHSGNSRFKGQVDDRAVAQPGYRHVKRQVCEIDPGWIQHIVAPFKIPVIHFQAGKEGSS